MTHFWLMKTEPDVFSIDTLKQKVRAPWDGVRNFQARNYMRDQMKVGDLILFYHSSTEVPGVAGIARVVKTGVPDFTAWDKKSEYYDPRSTKENPVWVMVEVEFVKKFKEVVSLDELRKHPQLEGMVVLKKGMRLSVQPVSKEHFDFVVGLGT